MRHRRALTASLCILIGSLLPGAGCQECDTSAGSPIEFDQGITSADRMHYESTAPNGEWLHFPAGRAYNLKHNLRSNNIAVQSYVTFPDSNGTGQNPSSFAEAAGNQVIFEPGKAKDDHYIRIRNDTCAEYFVRIVADVILDDGTMSVAGAAGTSGAAGASGAEN